MSLLNDFLRTADVKHRRGLIKCVEKLLDGDVIIADKKTSKFFLKLQLIEHIFDKRFTDDYEVTPAEMLSLYYHFVYDPDYGSIIWIIKKHNKMPRKAVADFLNDLKNSRNKFMYELNTLNLKSNSEL